MQIDPRRLLIFLSLCAALASPRASAAGDLDGITCEQADIAKAIAGRKLSNTTDMALEAKYKQLALKNLGSDMLDEGSLSSIIFWRVCNRNLVLLVDKKDVIADAIQFEVGAKEPSDDVCTTKDKKSVVVVRQFNAAGAAVLAWQLDMKKRKLVTIPLDGLVCPS